MKRGAKKVLKKKRKKKGFVLQHLSAVTARNAKSTECDDNCQHCHRNHCHKSFFCSKERTLNLLRSNETEVPCYLRRNRWLLSSFVQHQRQKATVLKARAICLSSFPSPVQCQVVSSLGFSPPVFIYCVRFSSEWWLFEKSQVFFLLIYHLAPDSAHFSRLHQLSVFWLCVRRKCVCVLKCVATLNQIL